MKGPTEAEIILNRIQEEIFRRTEYLNELDDMDELYKAARPMVSGWISGLEIAKTIVENFIEENE